MLAGAARIAFPFILGLGILWWMYRGTDWAQSFACVADARFWLPMSLSLLFGIVPQVLRALRWKMAIEPLGEPVRLGTCVDAVFMSYAASLVVPRVGEVTRCGTLKKYDGTSFTQSLGTVVTERLVDSVVMLLLTALAFLMGLPMMLRFLSETGTSLSGILQRFTGTGYLVTLVCLATLPLLVAFLISRYRILQKGKSLLQGLWEGITSLRRLDRVGLYAFYSVAIWIGYFLHFYIAFFCFDFTAGISPVAAFLIFCVGSFAVLVPTPNGAGPWHFAVKTMLVLYGVAEPQAILFALVVHTVQTALVVVLGVGGFAHLLWRGKR